MEQMQHDAITPLDPKDHAAKVGIAIEEAQKEAFAAEKTGFTSSFANYSYSPASSSFTSTVTKSITFAAVETVVMSAFFGGIHFPVISAVDALVPSSGKKKKDAIITTRSVSNDRPSPFRQSQGQTISVRTFQPKDLKKQDNLVSDIKTASASLTGSSFTSKKLMPMLNMKVSPSSINALMNNLNYALEEGKNPLKNQKRLEIALKKKDPKAMQYVANKPALQAKYS